MKPKEMKNECKRCKGAGIIEIFQEELGFETLVSCPECEKGIEDSLRSLLAGVGYIEVQFLCAF